MTSDYTLAYGTHPNPQDGRCAMEWVAHLAGERHSDQPACVSPVVRAVCVALNDGLNCTERQRLRPYLTRMIGTAGDGLDEIRAWMALDWLIARLRADLAATRRARTTRRHGSARPTPSCVTPRRSATRSRRWSGPAARRTPPARTSSATSSTGRWPSPSGETGAESAWSFTAAGAWGAARLGLDDPAAERVRGAVKAIAVDCAAIAARRGRRDPAVRRSLMGRPSAALLLRPVTAGLADSSVELLDRMLPRGARHDAPGPAALALV